MLAFGVRRKKSPGNRSALRAQIVIEAQQPESVLVPPPPAYVTVAEARTLPYQSSGTPATAYVASAEASSGGYGAPAIPGGALRHRRRHVYRAGIGVPVLETTASARAFQRCAARACVAMASIVMAHIVMAHIVMARDGVRHVGGGLVQRLRSARHPRRRRIFDQDLGARPTANAEVRASVWKGA